MFQIPDSDDKLDQNLNENPKEITLHNHPNSENRNNNVFES